MSILDAAHFWLGLTLLALGAGVLLAVWRGALGPTAFDRVLAVNSIGTIMVLAIAVFGFFDGRPEFLDIALLYALINFIGTIAVLKYFRHGTLGDHAPVEHAKAEHNRGDGGKND